MLRRFSHDPLARGLFITEKLGAALLLCLEVERRNCQGGSPASVSLLGEKSKGVPAVLLQEQLSQYVPIP